MLARLNYFVATIACGLAGLGSAVGFGYQRGIGWILPILALAVLFSIMQKVRPRRAGALAFCFGLGHFGLGVGWTFNSLHVYGNLPVGISVVIAGLLVILLAAFYALAGWLGRRSGENRTMIIAQLQLGAVWVLVEHLRTWVFSGFGWLAAGYAQIPYSPLAGYAPLIGTFGVTALCAISAIIIVWALYAPNIKLMHGAYLLLGLIAGIGLWLRQVDFTTPAGAPFTVSLLQGAIRQDQQWLSSNLPRIPRIYYDLAQRSKGKLLVAPESAFPFRWDHLQPSIRTSFHELLKSQNSNLVLGTFDQDPSSKQSRNAALVLGADKTQTYAKRHLTPYGEYLPFAKLLEPILQRQNIPYSQLVPGRKAGLFAVADTVIGLTICYESLFPRLFMAPPAQLLVNITNDSWFDGTAMPRQHLQIAAARAAETGRWLARASNTGPSALIDPHGFVQHFQSPLVRGVAEGDVVPMSGQTPYTFLGDWPTLLAALGTFFLRPRRKTQPATA